MQIKSINQQSKILASVPQTMHTDAKKSLDIFTRTESPQPLIHSALVPPPSPQALKSVDSAAIAESRRLGFVQIGMSTLAAALVFLPLEAAAVTLIGKFAYTDSEGLLHPLPPVAQLMILAVPVVCGLAVGSALLSCFDKPRTSSELFP